MKFTCKAGTEFQVVLPLTAIVAGAVLAMVSSASVAETFDDFNDNSMDASKWGTFTGHSTLNQSVTEAGQELALEEGGTIYAQTSYDPADPGGGRYGLRQHHTE